MPPFNPRRFDPYGSPSATNNNSINNNNVVSSTPSLARRRTLLSSGGHEHGESRTHGRSQPPTPTTTSGLASSVIIGGRRHSTSNDNNVGDGGTVHDRILLGTHLSRGSGSGDLAGSSHAYTDSYVVSRFPHERGRGNDVGKEQGDEQLKVQVVGAAPLTSQVHPLLSVKKQKHQHRRGGHPYRDGTDGGRYDNNDKIDRGSGGGGMPLDPQPHHGRHHNAHRGHSHHPQHQLQQRIAHLLVQTRRVLSLLLGQIPVEDAMALQKFHNMKAQQLLKQQNQQQTHNHNGSQNYNHITLEEECLTRKLLSAKSTARTLRLFLFLPILLLAAKRTLPSLADKLTRPHPWSWSSGVAIPGSKGDRSVTRRNLAGRNCVMNYFIEKQPPDEYDPDFVEIKPGEKDKDGKPKKRPPVAIVEGTYRTKGQVHVISRFIEAVANSFRSNTGIRQHLIFAETRDSGHLAYEALKHWPPRGKHKTMVHVLASGELPSDPEGWRNAKALGYGSLEDIEERFRGVDKARVYDRDGNLAGGLFAGDVDDDEVLVEAEVEGMDVPDKETLERRRRSGKNVRRTLGTNNNGTSLLLGEMRAYPDLRALLPFEEEDDGEGNIVVPYLHIDGITMTTQLQVLESARSLLEDHTIVVVGIEHSHDLDVRKLINFFREVKYKTFFLGARQVARIDNLCEEVLEDVLWHPSVSRPPYNLIRRLFMRLGLISKDELRIFSTGKSRNGELLESLPKWRETPPFFVAMPRGRRNKEEMTIQHMYDLFGGYGGGGGQIKTANDRKAPGK